MRFLLITCLTLFVVQIESQWHSSHHHSQSPWSHHDSSSRSHHSERSNEPERSHDHDERSHGPSSGHETDRTKWIPFSSDERKLSNESWFRDDSATNVTDSPTEIRENEIENGSSVEKESSVSSEENRKPSGPIVETEWATIEGVIESAGGENVSVFYGIPYAEPPVGKLRFRLPVPIRGRYHGIFNATTPKPACMQSLTGTPIDEPVSEDCLVMNIWVPRDQEEETKHGNDSPSSKFENRFTHSRWWSPSPSSSHRRPFDPRRGPSSSSHRRPFDTRRGPTPSSKPSQRYPVLFYIYGSQFKKHSSTYSPNRGGVTAGKGKVIFVGFNYRLQSFGFAFGGDYHMPGNQALYDIMAALQWTRQNIAAFGGDPDKITISGSSAGSELAALLALSPTVSPFLFDQVILLSAVPMRPTSIEPKHVAFNKTKALVTKLGCGDDFSEHELRLTQEQFECLQWKNATDIAEADSTDDITILGSCPDFAFMPIYGDDFMPAPPEDILIKKQARRDMKILAGSDHFDDVETMNYQPDSREEAEGHLDNMFTNMVKPDYNISHELEYLYDYYFDGVNDTDKWMLKERLGQLIGDNMFQCPLLLFLEKWATLNPVHYYYYNYTADAFVNSNEAKYKHGPIHGSANFMLLGLPYSQEKYSDRDRSVSSQMIRILSNFVHKGDLPWPPMLVSRREKVLPLEWVIDERVDTHNIKINPKLDICRFMVKLYHTSF